MSITPQPNNEGLISLVYWLASSRWYIGTSQEETQRINADRKRTRFAIPNGSDDMTFWFRDSTSSVEPFERSWSCFDRSLYDTICEIEDWVKMMSLSDSTTVVARQSHGQKFQRSPMYGTPEYLRQILCAQNNRRLPSSWSRWWTAKWSERIARQAVILQKDSEQIVPLGSLI